MIADMHCHYPMHLAAQDPKEPLPGRAADLTINAMTRPSRRPRWVDLLRARALRCASRPLNYNRGWRVSLEELETGGVRVVFSVLYEPFAELDFDEPYAAGPEDSYFGDLERRIAQVEEDLRGQERSAERLVIVKTKADLERAVREEKVAFMHCVEGGFHLGSDLDEIPHRVAALKQAGVVYITVAHLFFRRVATNAPAIPFLPDPVYKAVFRQPREGLTRLGETVLKAMYDQRMLIDLSHMSEHALAATLALLDRWDRETDSEPTERPVIATHAGFRLRRRGQEYMLSADSVRAIARRGGVIGLILARHQLNEGAGVRDDEDPKETPKTLFRHIEAIRDCLPEPRNDHVAIGSDLDGFINPTVAGVIKAGDMLSLEEPLRRAYGAEADKILHANALRVAMTALPDASSP